MEQALSTVVAALALSACSSRNFLTVQESIRDTRGRELTDLQHDLLACVISTKEYETLRKKVLRRPN